MHILAGWLLVAATGFAAEPEVEVVVADDGTVRAEVVVPHTIAEVRAVVDDPEASAGLVPEILSIEVTPGEPCQEVATRSRGLFRPLTYTARRCPTADGWTQVLVRSDDFDDYWSQWTVEPMGEQTRVTFQIRSDPKLPVPRSLVQKGTRESAAHTIENLLESLRKKR